jgi:hypothetical protein
MFKQNPNVDIDVMRFRLGGGTRYFSLGFFDFTLGDSNCYANYLYAVPFFCPVNFKADRIAFNVTYNVTGSYARLGIYEDNGKCYPGKLLLDAGEVNTGTNGVKQITISKILKNGKLYWLSLLDSGAITVRGAALTSALITFFGLSSTLGTAWGTHYWISYTYGVLPSLYPSGATLGENNYYPWIFLRQT